MAICPRAGQDLATRELDVGVRGGGQFVCHALNTGIATNRDYATISMDRKNLFNGLDRGEMLKAVAMCHPGVKVCNMGLQPFQSPFCQRPSRRDHVDLVRAGCTP